MQIKKTKFKGLKIVTNKIHEDSRGYFKEDFKLLEHKHYYYSFELPYKFIDVTGKGICQ